mmetsp:Transcript_3635/g.11199  ORF Transcript_3635/g.11199 Transcript_3635/m.11199 type:complete len:361 (-) Transcript_3635:1488-2570(-)
MEDPSPNLGPAPLGAAATHEEVAKVLVANVYAGGATVELDLPASTTIGTLKDRLRDSFAERPPPSDQRLIYCGKICEQDDVKLRDVLRDLRSPQTFHLVVANRGGSSHPPPPRSPPPPPPETPPPPQGQTVTPPAQPPSPRQHAEESTYEEALREGGWLDEAQLFEEACRNGQITVIHLRTTTLVPRRLGPSAISRAAAFARRVAAHPVVLAFDVKLLAKLAAVVALLGHDGDLYRLATLSFVAAVAFLVQTGIARAALAHLSPHLLRRGDDFLHLLRNPPQRGAGETPVAPETSPSETPQVSSRLSLARAILTGDVPDRAALGHSFLRFDVPLFFVSFFLSLAPPWRPQPSRQPRPHQD